MELKQEGNALFSAFEKFMRSIDYNSKVAVLHHTDPDGVCSGVIASKIVERLRKKKIDLRHNQISTEHKISPKTVELLRSEKITHLITTDITPSEDPKTLKDIESFAKILIIDHHKIYNDVASQNTIMIKPQLLYAGIEPSDYCSAKLIYDLGSRIIDISDLDWLAMVGVIGDCTTLAWKDFVSSVFDKYSLELKNDPFESEIGKVSTLLSSSEAYSESNIRFNYHTVYDANSFSEVLENKKLQGFNTEIQKEFNYWVDNITELAEFHDDLDLIFYLIEPKYNIKSPISTILGIKFPKKTLVTLSRKGDFIYFSGRRKDFRVPMNLLFEESIKGLDRATAGGHVPAAGGKVLVKDFEIFKHNLISNLKKITNNLLP